MSDSRDLETLLVAQVLTLAELLKQQDAAKNIAGVDYTLKAAGLITSQREHVLAAVSEKR